MTARSSHRWPGAVRTSPPTFVSHSTSSADCFLRRCLFFPPPASPAAARAAILAASAGPSITGRPDRSRVHQRSAAWTRTAAIGASHRVAAAAVHCLYLLVQAAIARGLEYQVPTRHFRGQRSRARRTKSVSHTITRPTPQRPATPYSRPTRRGETSSRPIAHSPPTLTSPEANSRYLTPLYLLLRSGSSMDRLDSFKLFS
jgi:hypothetical protein